MLTIKIKSKQKSNEFNFDETCIIEIPLESLRSNFNQHNHPEILIRCRGSNPAVGQILESSWQIAATLVHSDDVYLMTWFCYII